MDTKGSSDRKNSIAEGCLKIEHEDSTSSYDSYMCCESTTDSRSHNVICNARVTPKKTSSLSSACHETPRHKSNGYMHQPVRRRLFFGTDDENTSESLNNECSLQETVVKIEPEMLICQKYEDVTSKNLPAWQNSSCLEAALQGNDSNSKKLEPLKAQENIIKGKTVSRRIAQLVVWTKNHPGKGSLDDEKDSTEEKVQFSTQSDLKNPEGNLFFVQCPIRPANDASKKPKAPKRLRNKSPLQTKRKSKKRAAAQASSSGRAYRTYLHTCLEKQRQHLRSGADFKVEKLFQPDQGVALPGEVPPPPEPLTCAAADTHVDPTPVASHNIAAATNHYVSAFSSDADPTLPLPVSNLKDTGDKPVIESATNNGGCGRELTIFDLPERFTVSTADAPNEFDLLIQNVVHEEMVDVQGENEDDLIRLGCDRSRKRMRMSEDSVSNEDKMSMDDAGKPRCTYTELIEKALTETGGLTVSEIYNWISERYPFFKPEDDRWKNSVRHNLSINPYFKKGEKAKSGAGHLWTISEESKGLRPSMVSWDDERRKSPSDFSDLIMPMESETDRAVANILGQYLSECRANKEASEKGKKESKSSSSERKQANAAPEIIQSVNSEPIPQNDPLAHLQGIDSGATCNTVPELGNFNLNELNSGQFTVDLGGITIPEGGSINFEELVNAGRLIYITTDPDANKENDSSQAVILNECLLPELSAIPSSTANQQDDGRFNSFYTDTLSLDLEFGKGDSIPNISYANDASQLSYATSFSSGHTIGNCQDLSACGQLVPQNETACTQAHHQDLTVLDQVIPMSYEVMSTGNNGSNGVENLPSLNAALYESKELGISYTYQTDPNNHDLL